MSPPNSNICIVLPYRPAYSETFLRAQIERLSATVNYLDRFPVNAAAACAWTQLRYNNTRMLGDKAKASLHRYLVNPAKKIYLRNFFKTNRINAVLAEYGITGVGVMGTCEQLNLPLIVHFHGSDAYTYKVLDRYGKMYKKMFAYAEAIVAVSKHMVDQLVGLGAPAEKVFYNPYGVDLSKFKPTSLTSEPRVLAVGRFVEKKAPYLTILAFKQLLERLPDAKLVMVGDGILRDVCRNILKSLHIEHAVALKGAVNHDQVAQLMQESRVFVQHSLVPKSGNSEGTPVGILEAGATGLPVVSTAHAGIMDAVVHGKTGFLVSEGDIDGMSEYLYQLLTNRDLAVEMGKQAREHISANFNMDDSIKRLRAIIDKCLPEEFVAHPAQGSRAIL
jgi:colanic acid/amylovoran biosynthesis glycosyltransferase